VLNGYNFLSKSLPFFELDCDINRNKNIKKAFEYGYTKTEIAEFINLSTKTIHIILRKRVSGTIIGG